MREINYRILLLPASETQLTSVNYLKTIHFCRTNYTPYFLSFMPFTSSFHLYHLSISLFTTSLYCTDHALSQSLIGRQKSRSCIKLVKPIYINGINCNLQLRFTLRNVKWCVHYIRTVLTYPHYYCHRLLWHLDISSYYTSLLSLHCYYLTRGFTIMIYQWKAIQDCHKNNIKQRGALVFINIMVYVSELDLQPYNVLCALVDSARAYVIFIYM